MMWTPGYGQANVLFDVTFCKINDDDDGDDKKPGK